MADSGSPGQWQTQVLPKEPDHIAPDGTEIRLLAAFPEGDMWHATLLRATVSTPVKHKTVNELWYFLEGTGELWRRHESGEEKVDIRAGMAVSIPVGVAFQFRNTGETALCFLGVTIPRFPGPQEAEAVEGHWVASKPDDG